MKRLVTLLALVVVGFSTPAWAQFDSSDYRQNTYGPPTHYCDPARSLDNPGNGTLASPWNLTQAMQLASAGNVVGFLPGVGVRMTSTNNDNLPTFRPENSGTSSNRIVFVTRYAAVALPNVATNSNRTELRHNGSRAVANTTSQETGTGSAMYGAYQTDYITFDGFFVDMAQAQPKSDSGVIRVENSRGVHFRNFEIKGTTTNMGSNPVMYRPQQSVDTVLSNFRAYDFINDTSNSSTPQRALFSDQYGDQNFLIENFEIRNTQRGIFLKGTANSGTIFNYGRIRYGVVSNVTDCFRFNDLHATNLTTLEYSLCYDVTDGAAGAGVNLSSETTGARNLLVHHVTIARMRSSQVINGGIYAKNRIQSNVTVRDSIFDLDNGPNGHVSSFGEISTLPTMLNYNGYTKNGGTLSWAYSGVQYNSFSSWRTVSGRDANSQLLGTGLFVDRANGDFRINAGHAAMTASSTGGQIGAYAAGVTIGVRTGGTAPPTTLAAPTNLRITPGQ
jgi:hypothetical protein